MTAARPSRNDCYIAEEDPLPPEDRSHVPPSTRLVAIYREHRPKIMRFLSRRTAPDRAEDLVQDAFVRLATFNPGRLEAVRSPGPYLRRSAINALCNDALASERQSAASHLPIDEVDLLAPDQIRALEARDTLRRLEEATLRLRPLTREIFMAHRLDGYSYQEIAERTGLSVKGVEKHMSRAIAKLHRLLAER